MHSFGFIVRLWPLMAAEAVWLGVAWTIHPDLAGSFTAIQWSKTTFDLTPLLDEFRLGSLSFLILLLTTIRLPAWITADRLVTRRGDERMLPLEAIRLVITFHGTVAVVVGVLLVTSVPKPMVILAAILLNLGIFALLAIRCDAYAQFLIADLDREKRRQNQRKDRESAYSRRIAQREERARLIRTLQESIFEQRYEFETANERQIQPWHSMQMALLAMCMTTTVALIGFQTFLLSDNNGWGLLFLCLGLAGVVFSSWRVSQQSYSPSRPPPLPRNNCHTEGEGAADSEPPQVDEDEDDLNQANQAIQEAVDPFEELRQYMEQQVREEASRAPGMYSEDDIQREIALRIQREV